MGRAMAVSFSNPHPESNTLVSSTFPEHPRPQPLAAASERTSSAPRSLEHLGCSESHPCLGPPQTNIPRILGSRQWF